MAAHDLYRPMAEHAFDTFADKLAAMTARGEIRLRMTPVQTARAINALIDGLHCIALTTDQSFKDISADLAAGLACLVENAMPA